MTRPFSCSHDFHKRVGTEHLGSCDYPVESSFTLINYVLKSSYDSSSAAKKNPTLDFISAFRIEHYTMQDIFNSIAQIALSEDIEEVEYGYSDREAVCGWIYDRLENIYDHFVPKDYPRRFIVKGFGALGNTAISISIVAICMMIYVFISVYVNREQRAIRYAQLEFLSWVLGGKIVVGILFDFML